MCIRDRDGTYAASLDNVVPPGLVDERIGELQAVQDRITARHNDGRVGTTARVLVDRPGIARSVGEAPEIDGIIEVPGELSVGQFHDVTITESLGVDVRAGLALSLGSGSNR